MSNDTQTSLRALVADDEPALRRLLISALHREGFQCDEAENGEAASRLIERAQYQLVVTDLAMPLRHGHSLAVDLLAKPDRPVVVVLTGLLDPRLAKDLMARGVDDIVFKPVEFLALAAKLRSLVDRKAQATGDTSRPASSRLVPTSTRAAGSLPRISTEEVEARLIELTSVPALSRTGVEVYHLTNSPESSVQQVAAAVEREPALVADVLRFANSAFFNPTGKRITDVENAVVRLGQKRVGELAVGTATAATVAQETIPFMPLAPIWRKCLAAGICMEMLMDETHHRGALDGMFVTAVLQPMCRVILASMFPNQYEQMLKQAAYESKPIVELEQQTFAESAGAIAAKALAAWGIPEEIHRPLRYTTLPFHALSDLPEGLRNQVEFIKTAVFVGEISAQRFESWDLIDVPPASVLARLGIQSLVALVQQCRDDLEAIANWNVDQSSRFSDRAPGPAQPSLCSVPYKRMSAGPLDFLPYILSGSDIRLVSIAESLTDIESRVIVNCLDTPVAQLIAQLRVPTTGDVVIIANREQTERLRPYGSVLTLPCSYGALYGACAPGPTVTAQRSTGRKAESFELQTST